jgi:hypothetical protein
MSYTAKEYTLNSYTGSTWTALVDNSSGSQAVIIFNLVCACTTTAGNVKVRTATSGTDNATLLPIYALNVYDSIQLVQGPIVVNVGDTLDVWADQSGMEFSAHGAY